MKKFDFAKDFLSFVSIIITLIAIILSALSPEILSKFLIPLGVTVLVLLFVYIINYFKNNLEEHEKEINKLNENLNIHKEFSNLKAKVDMMFINFSNIRNKKGQAGGFIEIIIKIIQIAAIVFALYIIITAINGIPH